MSTKSETLSRREREIMEALYALGDRATAEEIRARLSDPPTDSAVRTMLARLEKKGVIRHREEGLRFVYSPVRTRASAQKSALSSLVRVFFGGSPRETATALLKQEQWTDDELEALRSEIERVRKERRQS